MTDEQLLRDTAKAVGYKVVSVETSAFDDDVAIATIEIDGKRYSWAPRISDATAFRLETDLGMLIDHLDDCVIVSILDKERVLADIQENYEDHPDKYAARRYATTRAAAEVGRQQ